MKKKGPHKRVDEEDLDEVREGAPPLLPEARGVGPKPWPRKPRSRSSLSLATVYVAESSSECGSHPPIASAEPDSSGVDGGGVLAPMLALALILAPNT
jgi:hypothetical protein